MSERRKKTCQRWTEAEKLRLTTAVEMFDGKSWKEIAKYVGTKNSDQCNQHWYRVLNPRICKSAWTADEDRVLRQRVQTFGHSCWKKISEGLPSRTDIQCRHRWVMLSGQDPRKPGFGRKRSRKQNSDSEEESEEEEEEEPRTTSEERRHNTRLQTRLKSYPSPPLKKQAISPTFEDIELPHAETPTTHKAQRSLSLEAQSLPTFDVHSPAPFCEPCEPPMHDSLPQGKLPIKTEDHSNPAPPPFVPIDFPSAKEEHTPQSLTTFDLLSSYTFPSIPGESSDQWEQESSIAVDQWLAVKEEDIQDSSFFSFAPTEQGSPPSTAHHSFSHSPCENMEQTTSVLEWLLTPDETNTSHPIDPRLWTQWDC